MMSWFSSKARVAVVRVTGTIAASPQKHNAVSAQKMEKVLTKAFGSKRSRPKAVAMVVNSPGGSAAQSSLIYKRILQLKKETGVPVYAFVEDVAASGGYYIACAADKIYIDDNSALGSIGVVGATFGLDKWIAKHKIERRLYTAGKKKVTLDPFSEDDPEERADLEGKLQEIHQNFKTVVHESRGAALNTDNPDLFEGDWWIGQSAIKQGLADEIGSMRQVLVDKFGEDVKIVETKHRAWMSGPWANIAAGGSLAAGLSTEAVEAAFGGVMNKVEDSALWGKYGITNRM